MSRQNSYSDRLAAAGMSDRSWISAPQHSATDDWPFWANLRHVDFNTVSREFRLGRLDGFCWKSVGELYYDVFACKSCCVGSDQSFKSRCNFRIEGPIRQSLQGSLGSNLSTSVAGLLFASVFFFESFFVC